MEPVHFAVGTMCGLLLLFVFSTPTARVYLCSFQLTREVSNDLGVLDVCLRELCVALGEHDV